MGMNQSVMPTHQRGVSYASVASDNGVIQDMMTPNGDEMIVTPRGDTVNMIPELPSPNDDDEDEGIYDSADGTPEGTPTGSGNDDNDPFNDLYHKPSFDNDDDDHGIVTDGQLLTDNGNEQTVGYLE